MRDAALRQLTFAQLPINAFATLGFVTIILYLKREFSATDQIVGLVSSLVAWRMRIILEELVGRVFGVIRLVVIIGMLPGSLAGGYIGDRYGTRNAMLVSTLGYALLAGALLALPSLRKDTR